MLLREILLYEPWVYKYKSEERGKVWALVAESLNKFKDYVFNVTGRSVRDRYISLEKDYKSKDNKERRASGIAPDELSEEEKAIEDIMSRFKESEAMAQKESNAKAKKASQDATRGEEMRLTLCFSLYQKTTF